MAIAVVVAHPGDGVIGAGGTIAKYAKKEDVYLIILSRGDDSTFILKKEPLIKKRRDESEKTSKILKNKVIFFGIHENNFVQELNKKKEDLKKLLMKIKPRKIFTHCLEDFNSHHREVAKVIKRMCINSEIYTFIISNPFRVLDRSKPRLYIDTSDTEILKLRAIRCFKSQWYSNGLCWYLYPLSFLRDKINGLKIRKNYSEIFYKL